LPTAGEVIVNEVNTLPGFTNISVYPKMWAVSGLPQSELLKILVEHAPARHLRLRLLSFQREPA
jgi:D-alanine-D-alanine ligase